MSYVDERLARFPGRERLWNGSIVFAADHGETLGNGSTRLSHSDD